MPPRTILDAIDAIDDALSEAQALVDLAADYTAEDVDELDELDNDVGYALGYEYDPDLGEER